MKRKRKSEGVQEVYACARLLCSAAFSIPGLALIDNFALPQQALGESGGNEVRFAFFNYREWQAGNQQRMHVNAPMLYVKSLVERSTEVEGSFVLDSISGASPLYHDTLSGASGRGIEDERTAGTLGITQTFDRFSVTVGGAISNEDDYDSNAGSFETKVWDASHNTILNFGVSLGRDRISSTNDSTLDEDRSTTGLALGLTQILDEVSIGQTNITYSSSDGYQSDPYKSFDSRPQSRQAVAWLTRYIRYFSDADGSLHLDYRYYQDNWGVHAHTVEARWYQVLGSELDDRFWTLIPRLRFYSQCKADYYDNQFPALDEEQYYSADQRLSGFGSVLLGIKAERELRANLGLSLSADYMQQRGLLKIEGPGSPGLSPFSAIFFSLGFYLKF